MKESLHTLAPPETASEQLVPVYHLTYHDLLPSILENGLQPCRNRSQNDPFYIQRRKIIDDFFDRLTRRYQPGFSRREAIYALVEPIKLSDPDKVMLEVMVDPKKVLVTDEWYWDQGQEDYERGRIREALCYAKLYWQRGVTLEGYNAVNRGLFAIPEVLIPQEVTVDRIRIQHAGYSL